MSVAWLEPLSGLYALGLRARAALYGRGLLAVRQLERPVVSVGNLYAWIAGLLLQAYYAGAGVELWHKSTGDTFYDVHSDVYFRGA